MGVKPTDAERAFLERRGKAATGLLGTNRGLRSTSI
jgi:hypothetical protein